MLNTVILFSIAVLLKFQLGCAELRFVPNVPEECQDLGYCDLPQPDYPEEHVERLIKTLGLQSDQSTFDSTEPIIQSNPYEVPLCHSYRHTVLPLVGQDTNGTWHFIINSKYYRQMYDVELCVKEGVNCSNVAKFYSDYNATCEQYYIRKVLKAIDHTGNIFDLENKIPSNCYCKVMQHSKLENMKSFDKKNLGSKYHEDINGEVWPMKYYTKFWRKIQKMLGWSHFL